MKGVTNGYPNHFLRSVLLGSSDSPPCEILSLTLIQRVMAVNNPVIFRAEWRTYGHVLVPTNGDRSTEPIYINLGLHDRKIPAKTYLHECLHVIYPLYSELEIIHLENKVWESLTAKQRFLLAKKLYNRKWRTR